MGTPTAVTADDIIIDISGCQHHIRYRLGCIYCNQEP